MKKIYSTLFMLASIAVNGQTPTVIDINPGTGSSNPIIMGVLNNELILATSIGTTNNGGEIYKSDGTTNGTQLVKVWCTEVNGSEDAARLNNKIIFSGQDGTTDNEPWITDGTTINTVRLKDIVAGNGFSNSSSPSHFVSTGNKVFFTAQDNNSASSSGLWVTDGTTSGTIPLNTDIFWFNKTVLNNKIYCLGNNTSTGASKIWVSDGTVSGSKILLNSPMAGWQDAIDPLRQSSSLFTFNNSLYMYCFVDTNTAQGGSDKTGSLWKIDVNTPSATLIKGVDGFSYINSINNKFYFNTYDPSGTNSELWISDGTTAGTTKLKNISLSSGLIYQNKVFSFGYDNEFALWSSDGTTNGTIKIKSLPPDIVNMGEVIAYNNRLYFFTYSSIANNAILWQSDGTSAGTVQLSTIFDFGSSFTILNGQLFFTGLTSAAGNELWKLSTTPLALEVVDNQLSLNCYPSPVKNNLILTVSEYGKDCNYIVFDVLGNKIGAGSIGNETTEIDVSTLQSGMYFLKVESNGKEKTTRFVKE